MRDISAHLGQVTDRWFWDLPKKERAIWLEWWRLRNPPPNSARPTGPGRSRDRGISPDQEQDPREVPGNVDVDEDGMVLNEVVDATPAGRSFWLGG